MTQSSDLGRLADLVARRLGNEGYTAKIRETLLNGVADGAALLESDTVPNALNDIQRLANFDTAKNAGTRLLNFLENALTLESPERSPFEEVRGDLLEAVGEVRAAIEWKEITQRPEVVALAETYRSHVDEGKGKAPAIDYAAMFKELAEESSPVASTAAPDLESGPEWPFVKSAAVLVDFDIDTLEPMLESRVDLGLGRRELLRHVRATVGAEEGLVRLEDGPRRRALRALIQEKSIDRALALNRKQWPTSEVGRVLRETLAGRPPDLRTSSMERLRAIEVVVDWLGPGQTVATWAPEEIQRAITRESRFTAFRALLGRWADGKFVEMFRGREVELRRLRSFVDAAESESLSESVSRSLERGYRHLRSSPSKPPFIITGLGGIGKSTLIAKFIVQHREAQDSQWFPFAYIDLDRPDLDVSQPPQIIRIAAAELAADERYDGFARGAFGDLAARIQAEYPPSWDGSRPLSFTPRDRFVLDFAALCEDYLERPFLIALDTFEVAQYASRDHVSAIFEMLNQLQESCSLFRIVIAGRSEIPEAGSKIETMVLTALDESSGIAFLAAQGVTNPAEAREIFRIAGGQPLSLRLAADLVQRSTNMGEIRKATGKSAGVIGGLLDRFRRGWDEVSIQGRLFERILGHLHDPRVRRIAHPGLVLRQVSADLIERVLAEPCGLGAINSAESETLFEELRREVSLVVPSPGDPSMLRHRPDLRAVMLPMILAESEWHAALIQQGAIAYYANRYENTGRASDRAEELYHRMMLGQPRDVLADRWIDGAAASLRASIDELPLVAQAFLAAHLGADRSDEVWAAADLEDYVRHVGRRANDLVLHGRPAEAYRVLGDDRLASLQDPTLDALRSIALLAIQRNDPGGDPQAGLEEVETLRGHLKGLGDDPMNLTRLAEPLLEASPTEDWSSQFRLDPSDYES